MEKTIVSFTQRTRKNVVYYVLMITCITSCSIFLYKILFDIENVRTLWQLGIPGEIALYSGVLGIMCEARPRITESQRNFDDATRRMGLACVLLLTVFNILLIILALFVNQ